MNTNNYTPVSYEKIDHSALLLLVLYVDTNTNTNTNNILILILLLKGALCNFQVIS